MAVNKINPSVKLFDPNSGLLTREGFVLIDAINSSVENATSDFVRLTATQTLTNKTISGDTNTLSNIGTASLKAKTGIDTNVVTGTAGTTGVLSQWDANGDIVSSGIASTNVLVDADIGVNVQAWDTDLDTWATKTPPSGTVVGTSDAQTLSAKTFSTPPIFPEYTVAGVPSAATYDNGVIIVSNEVGGRTLATSDGTNWRRVSDGVIVS